MLRASIDLRQWQPSYSVVVFVMAVERERIRSGEDSINVEVLPSDKLYKKTRNWYKTWPRSDQECKQCAGRIMLPMFGMLKSISNVQVLKDRDRALPGAYSLGNNGTYLMGMFVDAYAEGIRPLRSGKPIPSAAFKNNKLVTITLREADHYPSRNSNIMEWLQAAKEIRALGFDVVLVRDTKKAGFSLGDFVCDHEASCDLQRRAELYESAFCNMSVSNGPAWFGLALDVPMLIFRPTDENSNKNSTAESMRGFGIPTGGQLPGAPSYQRLIWGKDSCGDIVDGFLKWSRQ